MSGPKVIRIVTREERRAIARDQIRDVELAISELDRIARKFDISIGQHANRVEVLQALLRQERWTEVQSQAVSQVAYLRAEGERIREQAIAKVEAQRTKARRISDTARSVIVALERKGQVAPAELRNAVNDALSVDAHSLQAIEKMLARQVSALSEPKTPKRSSDVELATRLVTGEKDETISHWVAMNGIAQSQSDKRLDRLLSEIEVMDGSATTLSFKERASRIALEKGEARALLTDSLSIEVAEHVAKQKRSNMAFHALRRTMPRLQNIESAESKELQQRISKVLATGDASRAGDLVSVAEKLLKKESAAHYAAERRSAVLTGLASLGYEIRESMTTAWVNDGRLVVRKPNQADYGVEVASPPDLSAVQVRLVGSDKPATARTKQRDQDAENIWCAEFAELENLLGKNGTRIAIERAVPAGRDEVKTVSFSEGGRLDPSDTDRPTTRTRTL